MWHGKFIANCHDQHIKPSRWWRIFNLSQLSLSSRFTSHLFRQIEKKLYINVWSFLIGKCRCVNRLIETHFWLIQRETVSVKAYERLGHSITLTREELRGFLRRGSRYEKKTNQQFFQEDDDQKNSWRWDVMTQYFTLSLLEELPRSNSLITLSKLVGSNFSPNSNSSNTPREEPQTRQGI